MEIDSYGGGIYCDNSSPLILNTLIYNNEADYGGGIYCCGNSNPKILNVSLYDNCYDGIYIQNSNPVLINSYICDNQGKGIYLVNSSPKVINSTICDNSWGVYCRYSCTPNIYNSIILNNYHQVYLYDNECDPNFYYCDIEGGHQGFEGPGAQTYTGTYENNIDQDPLFEDGYHLGYGSPCIDAGTPDTTGLYLPPWDLDGNVRVWDGNGDSLAIVDMGCYEFGAPFYGVDDPPQNQMEFQLYPNYPNPFSNSTHISFNIPKFSENLRLKIFNIKGQLVKVFGFRILDCGFGVVWDGKDDQGRTLSNGIYLYQLTGKNYTSKIMKMILIR